MKNFCTVSDKNFLHFGLALYESLKNNLQEDFRLFYFNPTGISTNPDNFDWKRKEEKDVFEKYQNVCVS